MVVVSGEIKIQADQSETASELMRWVMTETTQEAGCISYRFTSDLEHAGVFHVFEEWESDEALAAHGKSSHMAGFREKLKDMLAGAPSLTKYDISNSGPLG